MVSSILFLAIGGLWLIMNPVELGLGLGEGLALISSFSFSLGILLAARWSAGLNRTEASVILGLFGAVMMGIVGLFAQPLPSQVSPLSLLILIAGGGLILLNFHFLNIGFQILSSALAGTILMLEAVFATMIGYWVFNETLSAETLFGGSLIILSAIALMRHERIPRVSRAIPVET